MKKLFFMSLLALSIVACQKNYTPKPRGYFRISFPDKGFHQTGSSIPYSFEIANYSKLEFPKDPRSEEKWVTVVTPANKADLHLTYVKLKGDLNKHIEESRKLAYDHSIKADAINERLYLNPKEKVYGTIYYIEGNAASPMQFYLTDSTKHFLRGALYIREIPNIDSISPVIDFLKPDVLHLIETFKWN